MDLWLKRFTNVSRTVSSLEERETVNLCVPRCGEHSKSECLLRSSCGLRGVTEEVLSGPAGLWVQPASPPPVG